MRIYVTYDHVNYEIPSTAETYPESRPDAMTYFGMDEAAFNSFEASQIDIQNCYKI